MAYLPSFGESSWMPLHIFLIILLVQWWAACYPGAEPGGGGYIVQRMASCRSERDSFLAALWFQLAHYCLRPWPWIVVAFFALASYPELRLNYLQDSSFDPGKGYAMAMRELCTPGLSGVMIVVFFAAFMSTLSTQINWAASYLVRDVMQPLSGGKATERELTSWSKWASLLIVAESLGVAAWMKLSGVSIDEAWKLLMALGSGTGLVLILRWFWWRINAWSEISAMLLSLVLYLLSNQPLVYSGLLGRSEPLKSEEQILLIALLTIVGWLLTTLLTSPEPREKLEAFYRKVRPWRGGWGPIAAANPTVASDRELGWALLASACGAGLVYFSLPLIGSLLFPQLPVSRWVCAAGVAICGLALAGLTRKLLGSTAG
jgi:Na+/proline symporter